MIKMNSVWSELLGNLLVSPLKILIIISKTDKELVGGVLKQVVDLLGFVDDDGAGLVDVLYEGDETLSVPGPGVLHDELLIPVQSEQKYYHLTANDEPRPRLYINRGHWSSVPYSG